MSFKWPWEKRDPPKRPKDTIESLREQQKKNYPGLVSPDIPDLKEPIDNLISLINDLGTLVSDLADFIQKLNPADIVTQIKELGKIIIPFSCIVPLLEQAMKAYNDSQKYDLDKLIQGPNLDSDLAHELARVFAIPYVGDLVKNQINLSWMDRYQKTTGRGFPTALDQLHYFANGGISSSSIMADVTSAIPRFFMDNRNSSSDKFNKGYRAALSEKRTHRPRP